MSDLGRTLVWSAAQVTLLAGFASVVCATILRRQPTASAQVATAGLAGCVVLTLASVCPLPAWWTCKHALPPGPVATMLVTPEANVDIGERHLSPGIPTATSAAGPVWNTASLRELWDRPEPAAPIPDRPTLTVQAVATALFLAGTLFGLGRLLIGLWAVERCRRASRQIDNPVLNDIAISVAAILGCQRQVALRECPDLDGPATAGWRRPVLLLPVGWRAWDAAELRAVIAHELAHIGRHDFAARVIASLGVALHFYHPLLHRLAARLSLQQELAADALAAPLVGGRATYLRVLAQLALRLEGPTPAWPARAFLSSPRTLMRRIQMLRSKEGLNVGRAPRGVLAVVLAISVAAVSTVRGPARETPPPPPPETASPDAPSRSPIPEQGQIEAKTGSLIQGIGINSDAGLTGNITLATAGEAREPFDLSYLPADAHGILLYRPAALLARPGMERIARRINSRMQEFAAIYKHPGALALQAENIEWVLSPTIIERPSERWHGEAYLGLGVRAIRTVEDFDWLKQMKALVPSLEEVRVGDRTCYRIPKGALRLILGPKEISFVLPDRRTILFGTKLPVAQSQQLPAWLPKNLWRSVEKADAAMALDCRDLDWLRDYARNTNDVDPNLAEVAVSAESLVVRIDASEKLTFRMMSQVASVADFHTIKQAGFNYLTKTRQEATATAKSSQDPAQKTISRFLIDLDKQSQWSLIQSRKQVAALWFSQVETTLPQLVTALFPEKP